MKDRNQAMDIFRVSLEYLWNLILLLYGYYSTKLERTDFLKELTKDLIELGERLKSFAKLGGASC